MMKTDELEIKAYVLSKSKSINGGKMMLKKKTMGHEKGGFGLIQNCLNG